MQNADNKLETRIYQICLLIRINIPHMIDLQSITGYDPDFAS